MNEFLRPADVCRILSIHPRTLFEWTHRGKIAFIQTKGRQYRYPKKDIITPTENRSQTNFCYCRVSTRSQSDDLQRQVDFFRDRFPNHVIIKDIGSGLNFKRKGIQTLLDAAIKGNIREIVVTHKDQLCRFGFELFERILPKCSNGKIVVLNHTETSPQEELINDLLSIITVFSSRLYGLRSHSIKKQIRDTIKEKCQSQAQNIEGSFPTNTGTENSTPIDDGTISMVL